MIAVIWVNLRRAMGDRRLLIIGTLVPVVIILITGLLEGSPKEPIGLYHPSARLLHLAQTTDGVKVRVESTEAGSDRRHPAGPGGGGDRPAAGTGQLGAGGLPGRVVHHRRRAGPHGRGGAHGPDGGRGIEHEVHRRHAEGDAGRGAAQPVLVRGAGQPRAVHGDRRAGAVGGHGRDAPAGGAAAALGRPGAQARHRVRSDGQHDGHRGQHGDRVDLRRVRAVPGALGQSGSACSW